MPTQAVNPIENPATPKRWLSKAMGLGSMAIGILVLTGWLIGSEPLKRVGSGFVAMNPVSAICFVISGLTLLLLCQPTGNRRWIGNLLALLVLAAGAVKISGYILGIPFRLDAFLFRLQMDEVSLKIPNQMAPNTALNFILVGIALLTLDGQRRRFPLSNVAALAAAAISLLALIGYAYGVAEFSRLALVFIPMALPTAIAFLVLATGLLFAREDAPLPRMLAMRGSTRVIAKHLFPASTLFIFSLGWLRIYGERQGFYPGPVGTALYTVIMIYAFTGLIWWTAVTSEKVEAAKRLADRALLESQAELQDSYKHLQLIMNHASELICSFDEDYHFVTVNEASDSLLGMKPSVLRGKSFLDLVAPEDQEMAGRALALASLGEAASSLTVECIRKDQTRAEIAWSFQWSSHYRKFFGVGRANSGLESMRAWDRVS